MTNPGDTEILDLHRELCAAVRSADHAFGRLYVAEPGSELARQHEVRYLVALAQAKAALRALEAVCGGATYAADEGDRATVASARRVC